MRERPARICVVRHGYFPDDPRVRREVGTLLDDGYDVDVVCLRGAGERKVDSWRSARVHRLPVRRRRGGAARYLWEYASFFVLAMLKVSALHATRRYDVVQVHTLPDPLVFAALLPKLTGARVVLDMHELMPEFAAMKFGATASSLPVRATKRLERLSARFADTVLAVSVPHASIVEPRIGKHMHVVPNVPDDALVARRRADANARPSPPVVITHGTMTEHYGVQDLIAALPAALREEPFQVLVVGDGEFLPELKRLTRELAVEDHVEFTGHATPADLAGHLARSTLGVVLLRKDGYGELCVPNKVFDYAAFGLPVVAADLWAMRTYFGPNGLLYFRSGDAADLAQKLVRALRDERLRSEVAARGKAVYEEVRWEKTSQTYLAAVRALVARR